MIYEKDLDESIARYQGETEPSIETCRKLAACLFVKKELFGNSEQLPETRSYSYAAEPPTYNNIIQYDSGTEFSAKIDGCDADDVWPIIDELMSTIQIMAPRLYANVMRKLSH